MDQRTDTNAIMASSSLHAKSGHDTIRNRADTGPSSPRDRRGTSGRIETASEHHPDSMASDASTPMPRTNTNIRRRTGQTDNASQETPLARPHAPLRPGAPLARLRDAGVTYDGGQTWAVRHVDLEVFPGDDIALIGPNGSGKTTLSRVIAGLLAPDEGTVELMGRVVADADGAHEQAYRLARRRIGAVFQNPQNQILTTRVREDVAFGPENLAVPSEQLPWRVDSALADVGLEDLGDADPDTLSGGQQQREAIADMLAMRPDLLVLDEPAAMLDPASRDCVLNVLDRLHRRGTTLLTVTHSPSVASRARRVLCLTHKDGRSVLTPAGWSSLDSGAAVDPLDSADFDESGAETEATAGLSRLRAVGSRQPSAANTSEILENTSFAGDVTKAADAGNAARNADTTHSARTSGPEQTQTPRITDQTARTADPDAPVVLAARSLSYRYADTDDGHAAHNPWVLRDIDLTLHKGEIIALRGANGSGKSTLLRLLALLDQPTSGTLDLFGARIEAGKHLPARQRRALRTRIGYAMQHPQRQLFADTVRADVAFGPDNLLPDLTEQERKALVDRAMADLGIADLADRSPFDLSGGQQRLAALAGVIAYHPRLLLLDEPSAGLDAQATDRLHTLLKQLAAQGTAILLATHSDAEARALGATVVELAEINMADTSSTSKSGAADVADIGVLDHNRSAAQRQITDPADHGAPDDPAAPDRNRPATDRHQAATGLPTNGHFPTNGSSTVHGSFLSHADPRAALLAMIAAMIGVLTVSSPARLLLALAGAGLFLAAGRARPRRLLRVLHPLLLVLALVAVVNMLVVRTGRPLVRLGDPADPAFLLTTGGAWAGILYSTRLLVLLLLGAAVVGAVSPTRLADGFTGLLAPLSRAHVHVQEIGLVLVLALRFLPLISDETRDIALAQAARGGSVASGSPAKRLRAMLALLIPVTAASARHAETTALALDARCYEEGITRTHLVPLRLGWRDAVLAAGVGAFLVAVIVLGTLGI